MNEEEPTVLYYRHYDTNEHEIRVFYKNHFVMIDHTGVEVEEYERHNRDSMIGFHRDGKMWLTLDEL